MTTDYKLSKEEIKEKYNSSEEGLSRNEVEERKEKYGKNEIKQEDEISPLEIFLSQFKSFLVIILIAAAIISYSISFLPGQSSQIDTILILVILLANGFFGFLQDYKAEKSIQTLRDMSSTSALVLREGKKKRIGVEQLVPGDIVFLDQGDSVPADARILDSNNLAVDESALTGESNSVSKSEEALQKDKPLAERTDMAYKGTNVTRGRAKSIVVSTGMETEVGNIADEIQQAEDKDTPFQREVDDLGKKIGIGVLLIVLIVAAVEFLTQSMSLVKIFLTSISLAVAAVPEGLPAIVTLVLALGSRRMVGKNALVRKLPVVESLGSVDVICTDKTGTLTEDEMMVRRIYSGGKEYQLTGGEDAGSFKLEGEKVNPSERNNLVETLKVGCLCNNAKKIDEGYDGDPTEIALLISASKAGLSRKELEQEEPRENEISFTSSRKMMSTVHQGGQVYTKGAPEAVLDKCDRIKQGEEIKKLTDERKKHILEKNDEFASDALRVLAFAYKEDNLDSTEEEAVESDLIFLGLQGMIDPPRDEVKEAVYDCRRAGIKVVMITGDNAKTAQAIGDKIGFNSDRVVEGQKLDEMSDTKLKQTLEEAEIFARASPSHKVRILKMLQELDHIVAMTGDGVNDAPALKNSDVGVSMGVRGTDVAQQSSDMILLDDNFKTIRDSISEGRGIFDNIRKFVNYLLSANAAEVLLVFLASILGPILFAGGDYLALTAVMLLWINLLTDGLPALALGVDPKSSGIMSRKPRSKDEGVINDRMLFSIFSMGIVMALIVLALFGYFLPDLAEAQTVAFTSLVIFELVRIQAVRSRYDIPALSNKWLWLSIGVSLLLQIIVIYSPLRQFFGTTKLFLTHWNLILLGLGVFALSTWFIVKLEDIVFS